MKSENGHTMTESPPWETLSTQVAGAVGELLRAQQELEERCRAAENRFAEIARREQSLDETEANLAARSAEVEQSESRLCELANDLERREEQLADLEARAKAVEASEREQGTRDEALQLRESEVERREAELAEIAEREARLSEREQALERERATCDESMAALAGCETEVAARRAKLEEREQAFEKVCAMLKRLTTALQEPTPENLAAALQATEKAVDVRPSLTGEAQASAPASAVDAACDGSFQRPGGRGVAIPLEDEAGVDISDLTPEETTRMRMLGQLGTASLAEIVATIRSERTTNGSEPRKKKRRQWPF